MVDASRLNHRNGHAFSPGMPERRLLLALLDLLAVNGALVIVARLRLRGLGTWESLWRHPLWFIILTGLWWFSSQAMDAYNLRTASQRSSSVHCAVRAAMLTSVAYLLVPYLSPPLLVSRLTASFFVSVTMVLLALARSAYSLVSTQAVFRRRALLIGAGWSGRAMLQALGEHGAGTYQVIGSVDDDPSRLGAAVPEREVDAAEAQAPVRVLGDRHALADLIAQHQISTLILAITHEIDAELLQILIDCLEQGVEIVPMPVLYEELTGRVPVEHVGENWYVAMPINHPGTAALWPALKRAVDVLLASAGLILLGAVLPFLVVAIYLDSPGPIFYTQERVGKGGRVFRVLKFRSMTVDAEKSEAVWAREDDPRVTRVGRLLRKTHADEFPQFWNILKGDMGAVGPRPERPEFVRDLVREIPFYRARHAVKPGMAGWALVKQGYGASKEDALIKLQYDLYYIKHQSVGLDMAILLRTVADMLSFRGRA